LSSTLTRRGGLPSCRIAALHYTLPRVLLKATSLPTCLHLSAVPTVLKPDSPVHVAVCPLLLVPQDPSYIRQPEPKQSLDEVRAIIEMARSVPGWGRPGYDEDTIMDTEMARPEHR